MPLWGVIHVWAHVPLSAWISWGWQVCQLCHSSLVKLCITKISVPGCTGCSDRAGQFRARAESDVAMFTSLNGELQNHHFPTIERLLQGIRVLPPTSSFLSTWRYLLRQSGPSSTFSSFAQHLELNTSASHFLTFLYGDCTVDQVVDASTMPRLRLTSLFLRHVNSTSAL